MTPTTLVIHLCRSIASIHLTELQEAQTFVQVLHYDLTEIPDNEFVLLGVLYDLKSLMCGREFFVQQVENLIIIDLKIATLDYENATFRMLPLIDLLEQLLQTVYQDTFIFESL